MFHGEDSQQYRLYNAERATSLFAAYPLVSPREAKKIVSELNPGREIGVVFTRQGEYDACYFSPSYEGWKRGRDGGHIAMTPSGRTVCVLLHELAHYFTLKDYFGNQEIESHGPEMAWRYVKLVWAVLGKNQAITLADAFVKHKVRGMR